MTHALEEGLHRQADANRADPDVGHVVRSGAVVAEADRRVRPTKTPALVMRSATAAGVAGLDFEVFGGVGIDDGDTRFEIVDERCRTACPTARW